MDNITTGHWIFAGISLAAFVVYLVWSYRKDAPRHKQYEKSWILLLGMLVIVFLLFVIKQFLT